MTGAENLTVAPPPAMPVKAEATTELKSPASPLPTVQEFDANTCSVDDLVVALKTAGGVVIRNLLTPQALGAIEADVRPWLEKDKPWNGDFFPPETRRVTGLLTKSETFALDLVGHKLWIGVVDALLTSEFPRNWVGDKQEASVGKPQLNNTIVFSIGPGARDQALHRDDQIHQVSHRAVAAHEMGRDYGIGFFVAGKPTTKANGATRFIPGSHLWDYEEGPPREDQAFYAELGAGDGFMMLSGCFHGGSANKTVDQERLVYSCFFTRSWLRQEENQYLIHDLEKLRKLPLWLIERAGWSLSPPFLGWTSLEDPIAHLFPEKAGSKDMF
ncbi:hypothetical protein Sste5346_004749 [Sporothrix stenoceras]|uniref:Phytanoyl-CoA dioxygenase family protein n=1 Tax=Sporothrix stenoceras TaxID=5173 RepID=A0ABR3Z6Y4_9PEZI